MLEIEQFSSVKGVEIEGTDMQFHSQFCSGCNSVPWQKEVSDYLSCLYHCDVTWYNFR